MSSSFWNRAACYLLALNCRYIHVRLSCCAGLRMEFSLQNLAWKVLTSPPGFLLASAGGHSRRHWQMWDPQAFPQWDAGYLGTFGASATCVLHHAKQWFHCFQVPFVSLAVKIELDDYCSHWKNFLWSNISATKELWHVPPATWICKWSYFSVLDTPRRNLVSKRRWQWVYSVQHSCRYGTNMQLETVPALESLESK